jgi:hypothetical protein
VKVLRGDMSGAVGTVVECSGGACMLKIDGIVNSEPVQIVTEFSDVDLTADLRAEPAPVKPAPVEPQQ